jgi:hypothetical protein
MLAQGLQENLSSGSTKKIIAISSRTAVSSKLKKKIYRALWGCRCSKIALTAGMPALALDTPERLVLIASWSSERRLYKV